MKHLLSIFTFCILITSCGGVNNTYQRNKEAREDEQKMQSALAEQALVPHTIMVDAETDPVRSAKEDDAADDPAIFVNREHPKSSFIVGTDKKAGLYSYDLNGKELDFHPTGKVNNVAVLYDFPYNGRKINIVAATNRTSQTISILEMNNDGTFGEVIGDIKTNVDDVYGFTAYQNNGNFYVISNGKNGVIEQFQLVENNGLVEQVDGSYNIKGIAVFKNFNRKVIAQPEGMVVDTVTNTLFVGVEEKYIQFFNATENDSETTNTIFSSIRENNKFISYDIEGLALFHHNDRSILVASIQGSFSYALFDVTNPKKAEYITSFALVANGSIDGAEETDGLEVSTEYFNADYPEGILVVQDGFNLDAQGNAVAQNFKIVDLRKVTQLLN